MITVFVKSLIVRERTAANSRPNTRPAATNSAAPNRGDWLPASAAISVRAASPPSSERTATPAMPPPTAPTMAAFCSSAVRPGVNQCASSRLP
jgi:hypothetical protein